MVHAPLLTKHVGDILILGIFVEQTFEKRQTAIGQKYVVQQHILNPTNIFCLLHHSRQLLMVAYQHKFLYSRNIVFLCT